MPPGRTGISGKGTTDPGDNLYWERLLGSTEGSLVGFYPTAGGGTSLRFRPPPAHPERIAAIHEGLLDFVRLFLETERRLGVTIPVSGRDAYAPMIAVCDRKNRRFPQRIGGAAG